MFRASCIQIKSNDSIEHNLLKTKKLIKKAVAQKANLVLTPEISSIFLLNKKKLLSICTTMNKDKYLKGMKKLSKQYKIWILIGSLIIRIGNNKLVNRSVLINNKGIIKSYYDKMHMYDANLGKKEKYKESKIFKPGKKIVTAKLPWGVLGMSICYDLRFPNLYRQLSKKGALFLSIPSAFTQTTGIKHWHTLLKARAIENFCYIFAPAQSGTHYNGRKTYGHSLIVSPDGKILKEIKKREGVITVNINPRLSKKLRLMIPSLNKD